MADLSLDEIIRRKNFKVQFGNNQSKGLQTNKATLNANSNKNLQVFDARSKLTPKNVVLDARDKISINKSKDARNKIFQKQVQKGTFDARSLIKRHAAKKTNGAVNVQGLQNNIFGIPQITRTLSNPVNFGQINAPQPLMQQMPPSGVSFSKGSLQVTKKGLGGPPPPPNAMGDSVPVIQIRNDRYQHLGHPPPNLNWSTQQPLPQPAHMGFQYPPPHHSSSHQPSSKSYSSQNQYHDLDDPNNQYAPPFLEIPKMHVSNIKAVEAAGMKPVSSRPILTQTRAPPGSATLSAKQPISLSAGVKRRQQPVLQQGGPLQLGKNRGPGLHVGIGESSPPKRAKMGSAPSEPIEVVDLEDNSKYLSPLQGFRVIVTNLFSRVTQEDIIELFGVVGPLKKARLLKAGSAEVVYCTREDAIKAVQKYHGRELDSQPMYVKMTTPAAATVKFLKDGDPDITGEALRLYKKPSSLGALPVAPIETPTIQRALFKVGPPAPNKSVKFTVKI